MPLAETYLEQAKLLITKHFPNGQIPAPWSTPKEGKDQKRSLVQLQKELRVIRRQLQLERQSINAQFLTRRSTVGISPGANLADNLIAGLAYGVFGKTNVGRINAANKRQLRIDQLQATAPFADALNKLDTILAQMETLKNEIDQKLLNMQRNLEITAIPPST